LDEFYAEIADWILPHVTRRPLALVRCPSGIESECFFQKHAWNGMSKAIRRRTIGDEEILFIEDLEGLMALVQSSCLEIHPWGSTLVQSRSPIGSPGSGSRRGCSLDGADRGAGGAGRLNAGSGGFVKTTGGKVCMSSCHAESRMGGGLVCRALAKPWRKTVPSASSPCPGARAPAASLSITCAMDAARRPVSAYSTRARPGGSVDTFGLERTRLPSSHFTVENLPTRLRHVGRSG
jgi:bifunctional non-homologous end joining protein LigD